MIQQYEIREINVGERRVTIDIRADMVGTLANHCKTCPEGRKSAQSARRFGYALAAAGDVIFGKPAAHPDLENTLTIEA